MFAIWKKPARLERWDGRKRSSRNAEPIWRQIGHRSSLVRLGLVLSTTVALTVLVTCWGHPFPYRVGQQIDHDLAVRVEFTRKDTIDNSPSTLPTQVVSTVPVTTANQDENYSGGKVSVKEVYRKGNILVPAQQPISELQLALLKQEFHAYRESRGIWETCQRGMALFLLFTLFGGSISLYVYRFQPELAQNPATIVGIGTFVVGMVALGLMASLAPWHALTLPITILAVIIALAFNPQFSMLLSTIVALIMVLALGLSLSDFVVLSSGLTVIVLLLRHVQTRTQLIQICCCGGLVFALTTLTMGFLSEQSLAFVCTEALRQFCWGTLAGFLLTGLLPAFERLFGIVTDISLREYADGSHPLLQELVRRAPGTYTHSITVSTLAEAAAESIGANPLLTRVGSYFHDVGKMLKPHYFVENQNGHNRHETLEPALSTLIIVGHVKDGVALAKQYGLPRPVIGFIEQHHGTTLVEYFYREAMRLHQANGEGSPSLNGEFEASFRYPGPKPQSREAGILMLADAVESASRCLTDPTATRIRKLVNDLLMKRLLDGQFRESGLTLSELYLIEESLCKSLIALFHVRIKYEDDGQLLEASAKSV